MKKSTPKIKSSMKIYDIVEKYPDVIPMFMSYGLHCIGCAFAGDETLEQGAKAHGIPEDEIKLMVDDCNRLLKELEDEQD